MIRSDKGLDAGMKRKSVIMPGSLFRHHTGTYSLFLLTFLMCTIAAVQPAGACFKKKVAPAWVTNATWNESGYYTGVGYAPKIRKQNDHVQKAREDALNELASAISVQIHSSNTWITIENNEGLSEDYRSLIQARVNTELENVELVEVFEDKKGYWVYYRLSKNEYAASVARRKSLAAQKSMSLYELAFRSEQNGDYRQAIVNYARCLNALGGYLSEPVQLQGSSVNLSVHPFERINTLINQLELRSPYDRLTAVAKGSVNPAVLPVELRDQQGRAVAGFPLIVWYSERAIAEPAKTTDAQGNAGFQMPQVRSAKTSELLVVSIDIQQVLAEAAVGFEVRRAILAMPVRKLTLPVEIRKAVIQIEIAENQTDKNLLEELVIPACVAALENAGYTVRISATPGMPAPDFRYRISCVPRIVGQQSGIVKVQITGSIQVYSSAGQLVSATDISPVDGNHLSAAEALRKAYQTLAGQLPKRYIF